MMAFREANLVVKKVAERGSWIVLCRTAYVTIETSLTVNKTLTIRLSSTLQEVWCWLLNAVNKNGPIETKIDIMLSVDAFIVPVSYFTQLVLIKTFLTTLKKLWIKIVKNVARFFTNRQVRVGLCTELYS